jgi:hypothetical protein
LNILKEAARLLAEDAVSVEDGYRLRGEIVGMPQEVSEEIAHLRNVSTLLIHAAEVLGCRVTDAGREYLEERKNG